MEIYTPHACLSTRANQSIANTASTLSGFNLESAVSVPSFQQHGAYGPYEYGPSGLSSCHLRLDWGKREVQRWGLSPRGSSCKITRSGLGDS